MSQLFNSFKRDLTLLSLSVFYFFLHVKGKKVQRLHQPELFYPTEHTAPEVKHLVSSPAFHCFTLRHHSVVLST